MTNYFKSPFKGVTLDKQINNPNVQVGRHSYYSGYYHEHSFEKCVRYLRADDRADKLIIGNFCSIGSGAQFIMGGNQGHRTDWISTYPFFYVPNMPDFNGACDGHLMAGNTVVGHDVWIGAEAVIMPGVTIGNGAVIGMRAMVTHDVEPYSIVAGNPAKVIRKRFSDEEIAMLQEMQWWDWSDSQLHDVMPILSSGDIDALYAHWQTVIKD